MAEPLSLPPFSLAVIGMAGRFPGAADLTGFWQTLCAATPAGRDLAGDAAPDVVRYGYPLEGIDQFDAAFFDMSPREAALTDPQHRLFLECAYHALEDAALCPTPDGPAIGVYAACNFNSYLFQVTRGISMLNPTDYFDVVIGNDKDYLASRVAYKLDLKGPAMAVQTACSSSLTAVAVAAQALLSGQCDVALAGGVGVRPDQDSGYRVEQDGALSADGRVRAFSDDASGVADGNGVGVVVLRRLEDAVAAGDRIYAVIRSAAVNNDGAAKAGFSAPSVAGQAAVIEEALALADVPADSIGYLEAHGTGTPIGDPIEVAALRQAWHGAARGSCVLGSVKTVIGHLNAAAGIAGLIKAVLALHHRQRPGLANFHAPNPDLGLDDSPFVIQTATTDWPEGDTPRRAAVSSFGLGGTNVHLILEQAPVDHHKTEGTDATASLILPLSARSETALLQQASQLAALLEQPGAPALSAVAYTLCHGRRAWEYRCAVQARTPAQAVRALRAGTLKRNLRRVADPARPAAVCFVFPGAGAQQVDMGLGLYRTLPAFADAFDRCAAAFRAEAGVDLLAVLSDAEALQQPVAGMAALFAVDYALACSLMAAGVVPDSLMGHSLGEYVAATLAGVFTLPDAVRLITLRARLIASTPAGGMMLLPFSGSDASALCGDDIAVAVITGPTACIVSGASDALQALAARLDADGRSYTVLAAERAGHSPLLDPVLDEFRRAVASVPRHAPRVPLVSNVSGTWLTAEQATDPAYWVDQLRQTVRLSDGIGCLAADPDRLFLEVGPGRGLSALIRKHPAITAGRAIIPLMKADGKSDEDVDVWNEALARIWAAGGAVPLTALAPPSVAGRPVSLPPYPFDHRRHWADGEASRPQVAPLADHTAENWLYQPVWQQVPWPPAAEAAEVVVLGPQADHLSAGWAAQGWIVHPVADLPALRALLQEHGGAIRFLMDTTLLDLPLDSAPQAVLAAAYHHPVALAALLADLSQATPLTVLFAVRGLAQVQGTEAVDPLRAAVLGPCRVLPFEVPAVASLVVDWPENSDLADLPHLLSLAEQAPLSLAAVRHGRLWLAEVAPVALPARPAALPVVAGAAYLILGGSGGIGMALAQWLAQRAEQEGTPITLVPVQRRPPQAALWDGLRSPLVRVEPHQADLADPAALAAVVAAHPSLRGVIHAAGVSGGGLMQAGVPQGTDSNFGPKVFGLLALEQALAGRDLDFILLSSSLGAFSGTIGQVDNTAANCVLDAWAMAHPLPRCARILSLNWDVWREVGMITALGERHRQITGEEMTHGHSPEQARWALERALAVRGGPVGGAQVAISTRPLPAMLADLRQRRAQATRVFEQVTLTAASGGERPDLLTPLVPARHDVDRCLLLLFEERLGIHGLGINDDYVELGGDSLLAMPLTAAIRDTFAVPFPVAALFRTRTVARIADHLMSDEATAARLLALAGVLLQVRAMSPDHVKAALMAPGLEAAQ
ncbi:type I polyketide synthase [Insolitispirillum peregrinum]|uniref:Acyl transferase domain-containing protein n=1 Tax=Insolitispirillum peregrinum TaxID=80876 RepID=A0A1N7P982_9PROT|nr:type I polyketide synthase [Insolitispirillum peregrinum]SIT07153.1 Acyl transferase domain-containing protein [Insolitispirillum peregrinum]